MSKHGRHVKDPEFKKRFRVDADYSLEPETGFPKNLYRVKQYCDGEWLIVPELEPFETRKEAEAEIERMVGA